MKKIISIILAALMMAMIIPTAAFAAIKLKEPGQRPTPEIPQKPVLSEDLDFSITFYGNHIGVSESSVPAGFHATYTISEFAKIKKICVMLPQQTPKTPCCRFIGWATSPTAKTAKYLPGDTITLTLKNHDVKLYAVWTPIVVNEASVTLYPTNDSYHLVCNYTWGEFENAPTFTLPTLDPTEYGMESTVVHSGWHDENKTHTYECGAVITLNPGDNLVLYADWISYAVQEEPEPEMYSAMVYFDATVGAPQGYNPETEWLETVKWNPEVDGETYTYQLPVLQNDLESNSLMRFVGWENMVTDQVYPAGLSIELCNGEILMLKALWVM